MNAGDGPNAVNPSEPAAQSTSQDSSPTGIATVVEIKGQVKAVSKSTGGERSLQEGDAIYLDETIMTASGASLQMEVADESLFTISENTSLRMDLFDLDESKKDGHLAATVSKGVFRFVSGKVAKVKPENVQIEVPSGTIGIRGTIVIGEIEGEKCLVSLEAEEGDKAQHRVIVSNRVNGQVQQVEITKPGFATIIEGRQAAPKPAFQLPQENRARFQQKLPAPKFLPRNAEGRPMMNRDVRDPQKSKGFAGKQDERRNNPGGPNPPNGPNGSGPGFNRRQEPQGQANGFVKNHQPDNFQKQKAAGQPGNFGVQRANPQMKKPPGPAPRPGNQPEKGKR